MSTFVALFRGINVGGKHVLPMQELKTVLQGLGCSNVRTYIQSGNAIFNSAERSCARLATSISAAIKKRRGFAPHVVLLSVEDLEQAVAKNPFPEATADPKSLHVGFLAETPGSPDLKTLAHLASVNERFRLVGSVFYVHAPDGIGKSKLAASAEKCLGVSMTDRNWRTISTLLEMARGGIRRV